jgi:F-type H+-transporting ATPase subunit a
MVYNFSSSEFEHGEAVAESNGNFYAINHHDGKNTNKVLPGKIIRRRKHGFP